MQSFKKRDISSFLQTPGNTFFIGMFLCYSLWITSNFILDLFNSA